MATYVQKLVPALAALGIAFQLTAPALAQYSTTGNTNNNGAYTPPPTPNVQQGQVQYVPAGVTFPVTLSTAISTDVARPGDMVQAMLNQPINLGNGVIPAGTIVVGQVGTAKGGGFLGRAGQLGINFNRMRTPNGQEVPMAAHVVGSIGKYDPNGGGVVAGETWKTKVGQGAIRGIAGAGLGAELGTAVGAIAAKGSRGMQYNPVYGPYGHQMGPVGYQPVMRGGAASGAGRGAWSGAAIGGGLGVVDSLLLRKGKNVNIASGTPMNLQLDAPITLSSNPQYGAF